MTKVEQIVKVGIADLNVVREPGKIRTIGLGSCVGVVIYDERRKVAGLAHILLPDSKLAKQESFNNYKYADTAVPLLVEKLLDMDAKKYALKAKLAGGAEMFKFISNSDLLRVGPRNINAVLEQLKALNIPVIAKDVGGSVGRTIEFDPATSKLLIKKVNKEEFYI